MYGATLTLLRARIAERLRIFDVYVIHDRHRHHHHLHHLHHIHHLHHLHHHPLWRYVDAIIRFSIFATGGKDVLIPYEDMLMLLSDSAYLPQGVKDVLIPYEDMLMLLSDSAYLPQGEGCFDPLWRYVDATFRFSIFATGGKDVLIPYEDMLMLVSYSADLSKGVVFFLLLYEDKLMWLPHLAYLSEGVVDFWSLMKIGWRYSLFNIFVRGGGGCWSLMKISGCDYPI